VDHAVAMCLRFHLSACVLIAGALCTGLAYPEVGALLGAEAAPTRSVQDRVDHTADCRPNLNAPIGAPHAPQATHPARVSHAPHAHGLPYAARALDARRPADLDPHRHVTHVSVTSRGSRFASKLETVIEADVIAMRRLLQALLDVPLRPAHVDLTLYGSREALQADHSPDAFSATLAGFYLHGTNHVGVADQDDFDATRRVARHEATHALLAAVYGPTPVWLNEGLADAMETLRAVDRTPSLGVRGDHALRLREALGNGYVIDLRTLLAFDAPAWNARSALDTYAPAWALVHELLTHEAGRALVRVVLGTQLAYPCAVLDSIALVEDVYPGGVAALERRWQARMRHANWQPLGGL
jgi:hypothetical protein